MTKVAEVAEILMISRNTVYRKINELSLKKNGCVTTKNRSTTVTDKGIELIRLSLDHVTELQPLSESELQDTSTAKQYQQLIDVTLVTLNGTIEELKNIIKEKDILIEDLRKDKDRLMQMQENSQVLLVREQERVLMLEENKGFWSRFKKKQSN